MSETTSYTSEKLQRYRTEAIPMSESALQSMKEGRAYLAFIVIAVLGMIFGSLFATRYADSWGNQQLEQTEVVNQFSIVVPEFNYFLFNLIFIVLAAAAIITISYIVNGIKFMPIFTGLLALIALLLTYALTIINPLDNVVNDKEIAQQFSEIVEEDFTASSFNVDNQTLTLSDGNNGFVFDVNYAFDPNNGINKAFFTLNTSN